MAGWNLSRSKTSGRPPRTFAVSPSVRRCYRPGRGVGLWLKPENLQPIGAFKLRGAYHAMACLDPEHAQRGVVTHSSGNHGRALAYAAAVSACRP